MCRVSGGNILVCLRFGCRTDAEKKAEEVSADFAAYRGKIESERREARVAALVKAGKVRYVNAAS